MDLDPGTRSQLFKTARLWLLAVVCASVGAAAVWRTNDVTIGVLAFLTALGVLGLPLWGYERSRRARKEAASKRPRSKGTTGRYR